MFSSAKLVFKVNFTLTNSIYVKDFVKKILTKIFTCNFTWSANKRALYKQEKLDLLDHFMDFFKKILFFSHILFSYQLRFL
jgi:hypothetical protein